MTMSQAEVNLVEFMQDVRSYLRNNPDLEELDAYSLGCEMESLAEYGDLDNSLGSATRAGAISFLLYMKGRNNVSSGQV
jgi:hypothetical protein